MNLVECTDDFILKVATILGTQSAASAAIRERDRRLALGEDAVVFWNQEKGVLLVGPRPAKEGDE